MATIEDQPTHVEFLDIELSALSLKIGDEQKDQATDKAMMELRWVYPITDQFKVYWAIERGKRHALYVLLLESAHKFKYKQIHLNHRFDHYYKLLEIMDKEFQAAIDSYPTMFPGVDVGTGFTDYIPSGFDYDFTGKDISEDYVPVSGDD